MLKTQLYNQKGEKIKEIDLSDKVFGVDFNPDLIHQVVVSQMANRRQVSAHTKDRGEVRGGGRKPWRQKGTGRARVGSNRSPIWRGGGITFGPTNERNFKKIIPLKMKRKALLMALTQKAKDKAIIILDTLKLDNAKTKEMASIIQNLEFGILNLENKKKGSILVVLPKKDENIIRAGKNISKTEITRAMDLNCLDILKYKYIIITEKAIDVIEKTFVL